MKINCRFNLLFLYILVLARLSTKTSSLTNQILENHIILSQSTSLISKHILYLTQTLIHRCVVSSRIKIILLGITSFITNQDRTLEEFDHLHSHHKGDGHEVGEQKPPDKGENPEVGARNIMHDGIIAVFKHYVENGTN